MTTLQLNQSLFRELTAIAGDEAKLRQAVAVLHLIAMGKLGTPEQVASIHNEDDRMTDGQWEDYFASKPARVLPKNTDTERFVLMGGL